MLFVIYYFPVVVYQSVFSFIEGNALAMLPRSGLDLFPRFVHRLENWMAKTKIAAYVSNSYKLFRIRSQVVGVKECDNAMTAWVFAKFDWVQKVDRDKVLGITNSMRTIMAIREDPDYCIGVSQWRLQTS